MKREDLVLRKSNIGALVVAWSVRFAVWRPGFDSLVKLCHIKRFLKIWHSQLPCFTFSIKGTEVENKQASLLLFVVVHST